ncbi:hypothetical protein MSG28_003796 [Choristoneura fumiferana]|uniref:Uncharacterized protein n=1 Tax=Choristoneura fumiferana TaxID=7141 RepID=A0ACC0KG85_CHOFU|nr:hypothetical protein MSG28_003796 [Choristoneura fumiferana]
MSLQQSQRRHNANELLRNRGTKKGISFDINIGTIESGDKSDIGFPVVVIDGYFHLVVFSYYLEIKG